MVDANQGKRELEQMLQRALETENVDEMEQIYHMIVDRTNRLRAQYNLPVRTEDNQNLSVLRTNAEQLKILGTTTEVTYGPMVMSRALQKSTKPSVFEQSFVKKDKANQFQSIVLNHVRNAMPAEHVHIFPPLLLRSGKQGRLVLHIEPSGVMVEGEKPNFMIILSDEGPIVPVVDSTAREYVKYYIERLYSLTGLVTVNDIREVCVDQSARMAAMLNEG